MSEFDYLIELLQEFTDGTSGNDVIITAPILLRLALKARTLYLQNEKIPQING